MVNDLDCNAPGLWLVEGARSIAVKRSPRILVDLCLQARLQRFVRIIRAEEVSVADEEALLVVVRINKPARNFVGAVAANFAGAWVEDIYAANLHFDLVIRSVLNFDVRLAEDDKQVALARVLQVFGHVQVGVHACLQHRNAAQLVDPAECAS